jgi:hypothetical protein
MGLHFRITLPLRPGHPTNDFRQLIDRISIKHPVDVACPMQHANDIDAVVRGAVEDQMIGESFDPPDA